MQGDGVRPGVVQSGSPLKHSPAPRPHTSYLVCATNRSGSHFLCEALWSLRIAGNPDEYFEVPFVPRTPDLPLRLMDLQECMAGALMRGTTPNGVFGGKIMWNRFSALLAACRTVAAREGTPVPSLLSAVFPNLHYVWLTRQDTVRQAISWHKADQTGIWWLGDREQTPREEPVYDFEAIDLRNEMIRRDNASWQAFFEEFDIRPFRAVYEDLIGTRPQTGTEIVRYLGLTLPSDSPRGQLRMRKQADAQSEEWYRLYQEQRALTPARAE